MQWHVLPQLGSIKSLKFHVSRIIKKCIGNQSRIYDRRRMTTPHPVVKLGIRLCYQGRNRRNQLLLSKQSEFINLAYLDNRGVLNRNVSQTLRVSSIISCTCSTFRTGLKNSSARLIPCVEHMLCLSHHYYGWLSPCPQKHQNKTRV